MSWRGLEQSPVLTPGDRPARAWRLALDGLLGVIALTALIVLGYRARADSGAMILLVLVVAATALVVIRRTSEGRPSFAHVSASTDPFEPAIDTIPSLVWSARPDGSAEYLNQGWRHYTGLSMEQAVGWGWTSAIHAEDLPRLLEGWQTARESGEPLETEARLRRSDGVFRWFLFRGVALKDGHGHIVKWHGTNTDIEDRKAAEDSLRRSERVLREQASLLELTHDTVFVRDPADVITYWNRGAEEQYGWTRDEAINRVTHDLLQTVFSTPLDDIRRQLLRAGRWEGELIHTRRDGTPVVVASRWALQRDAQGEPARILETNNDITERTRNERALADVAGRLIYAQEDERSRIGRELHDHVSQRLGILAINIDRLQLDPMTPEGLIPSLVDLREQTAEICDDIRNLSHRLHSSMLDLLGIIPALKRLVDECAERYAIPIAFTPAPLPAPLPSDVALCLFRVAEEALANIARHSQAAAARVEVAIVGDGVRLTVADEGVGFDPNRLDARPGLGFVSMRERLRLVRGTVRVRSAPSQGTTVEVWVPARQQE